MKGEDEEERGGMLERDAQGKEAPPSAGYDSRGADDSQRAKDYRF